jgi:uncharacterized membrane protein YjfL (UPF0719 family)
MAGDYHRGEMDIHEQSATYAAFGNMAKWGSLAIAVLLLTITLWFCTPRRLRRRRDSRNRAAAVLGVVFLREKPASAH